jgi:signal transduction histidine kinase
VADLGWRGRLPRAWLALIDVALAVALTALAEYDLIALPQCCRWGALRTAVVIVLTSLQTLPVAFRRRAPMLILLITGSAALTQLLLHVQGADFGTFGVLVAFYTVVTRSSRRFASWLGVLTVVGIVAVKLIDRATMDLTYADMLFIYAQFATAWALGDAMRSRAKEAAAAERRRLAREMHDVVSHGLSVMLAQASAARTQLDTRPESARERLESIQTVGQQAWTEMRRLLDLERDEDDDGGSGPPAVEQLESLVRRLRDSGLAVDLAVTGDTGPVPDAVARSVYRIVQQALTNTLTHAGAVRARVAIDYGRSAVRLEVSDEGERRPAEPAARVVRRGRGLAGMRERVALLGGELSTEQRADGFTVRALIPLETAGP